MMGKQALDAQRLQLQEGQGLQPVVAKDKVVGMEDENATVVARNQFYMS